MVYTTTQHHVSREHHSSKDTNQPEHAILFFAIITIGRTILQSLHWQVHPSIDWDYLPAFTQINLHFFTNPSMKISLFLLGTSLWDFHGLQIVPQ